MISKNHPLNSIVSIVKAGDYVYKDVYKAIENSLELIGGLEKIVKPSDNVFIKINHLPPSSSPEKGIITHPVFLKAVLRILKTITASITVGDDIGTEPIGAHDLRGIDGFQISGTRQVCKEANVELINLREAGFIETSCDGLILNKVNISKIVVNADVIINLPKLKTHSFTIYTGGIKNMFGTIPKGDRLKYHDIYHNIEHFNQVLIDVFSVVKPHLTIMDGIVAMEGSGPASGQLRKLGIILASQDTVALDTVATKIIGLNPQHFLSTKYAQERGLGTGVIDHIITVGENINRVAVTDFEFPNTKPIEGVFISKLPTFVTRFINGLYIIKPRVVNRLCIGCLECKKACPANAISIIGNKASINQDLCITCYCCHEVCRSGAILLRQTFTKRFLLYLINMLRRIIGSILRIFISTPKT